MFIITDSNTFKTLKVLDENGEFLGVLNTNEAINTASSNNLDVVCINDSSTPPLCKITKFGKLQYEQKKKQKENKTKKILVKEVQFRPTTDDNDISIKVGRIHKFLSQGNRVKIKMTMKGREGNNSTFNQEKFDNFMGKISNFEIESDLSKSSGTYTIIIKPSKQEK
jgi:translation initiation factor IF-3